MMEMKKTKWRAEWGKREEGWSDEENDKHVWPNGRHVMPPFRQFKLWRQHGHSSVAHHCGCLLVTSLWVSLTLTAKLHQHETVPNTSKSTVCGTARDLHPTFGNRATFWSLVEVNWNILGDRQTDRMVIRAVQWTSSTETTSSWRHKSSVSP